MRLCLSTITAPTFEREHKLRRDITSATVSQVASQSGRVACRTLRIVVRIHRVTRASARYTDSTVTTLRAWAEVGSNPAQSVYDPHLHHTHTSGDSAYERSPPRHGTFAVRAVAQYLHHHHSRSRARAMALSSCSRYHTSVYVGRSSGTSSRSLRARSRTSHTSSPLTPMSAFRSSPR